MNVELKSAGPHATLPGPSRTIIVEPLERPREAPRREPVEAPEREPERAPDRKPEKAPGKEPEKAPA